jgi:hypothetical protein
MSDDRLNSDDLRDELPSDLDVSAFVGPYQFPDNSRRRIPAVLYLLIAVGCFVSWLRFARDESIDSSGLVNDGMLFVAIGLTLFAAFVLGSSWKMTVSETDALVHASRACGFAVGHASAQQVWRGVRSRPTWRVLCYSAEDPPLRRALVLIDAVDARVVERLIEDNPESSSTGEQ